MEAGKRQEMIVLRNHVKMGKDEEEIAVDVKSDKDLSLGFTTAHTLDTLDWTFSSCPPPSNFTSHF